MRALRGRRLDLALARAGQGKAMEAYELLQEITKKCPKAHLRAHAQQMLNLVEQQYKEKRLTPPWRKVA